MDHKVGSTVMWCGACWAYVEWIHKCKGGGYGCGTKG